MGKVAGLVRKKSAYFFAKRIPEDIRHLFGGRQQISHSLNTTDYRVACGRALDVAKQVSHSFAEARLGKPHQYETSPLNVTDDQMRYVVRRHLFDLEANATPWPRDEESRSQLLQDIAAMDSDHEEMWIGDVEKLQTSWCENIAFRYLWATDLGTRFFFSFGVLRSNI